MRKILLAAVLTLIAASAQAVPKLGFFNIWGSPNEADHGAPVQMQGLAIKASGAEISYGNKYDDAIIAACQNGGLCEFIPYVYTNNKGDAQHMYNVHGVRKFVFGNEPELMPEGLEGYMYNLSGGPEGEGAYWVVHNEIGADCVLIAGNNQDHTAPDYMYNYDPSFRELNDMVGFHPYSDDPATGLSIGSVIAVHNKMVQYGDGSKQMFLGEGWGPKRQLWYLQRPSDLIPIPIGEIDGLRSFVVNGYNNLTTAGGGYDPSWIYGALFFTLSDNWGYEGGSTRKHFNGGIIDYHGNPKDDLLLLFPGNRLTTRNCGFEHYSAGSLYGSIPFWELKGGTSINCYALDTGIRRGGVRSARIELVGAGQAYIQQTTANKSVTPGQACTFAAWVRTDDVVLGSYSGARLGVQFFDSSGNYTSLATWSAGRGGTTDWTQVAVSAVAPANSARVRVYCDLVASSGRAWFDDCGITLGSSPRMGTIEGYVINLSHYAGVNGATVIAQPGGYTATTDSTGKFVFPALPAGAYDLSASKASHSDGTVKRVVVAPDRISPAGMILTDGLYQLSPRSVRVYNPGIGGMLKLTWEPPLLPVYSYNVYRSTNPDQVGTKIFNQITSLSVWDTTLANNTSYYYRVRSVSQYGEESPTFYYRGYATASTVACDVINMVAAPVGQGKVRITWDTNGPTTSRVDYGPTASYGYSTPTDSTLVDTHAVVITGLAAGNWRCRAKSTRSGKPDAYSLDYKFTIPTHVPSMMSLRSMADGLSVGFTGVVSAVYGDRFYVESTDRLTGIRVNAIPAGVTEGMTLYISGVLATDSGERAINLATFAPPM